MTIVAINITSGPAVDVLIADLGVTVLTTESLDLTSIFQVGIIQASSSLRDAIDAGDIKLNDGSSDILDPSTVLGSQGGVHGGTHVSDGSDPIPSATVTTSGIVELATDGESSPGIVVQGNDSRLSDPRTPTAHVHDASDISSGVLSTQRLPITWNESPSGVIDGVNKTFNLLSAPAPGQVMLFLNGVLQSEGSSADFTISSSTVTFVFAPKSGDSIVATYSS